MTPLAITATALSLVKATGLADWIGNKLGGAPGQSASRRLIEIAEDITEVRGDPEALLARVREDAEASIQIAIATQQAERELIKLDRADRADARAMHTKDPDAGNRLARQIMVWNLPAIFGLVGVNAAAITQIDNPTVAVAIGNVIGASISYLWQERAQVVGFYFGSSTGSKEKQGLLVRRA